jgi:phosphonate utilization transcriptional regulator
LQIVDNRPGPAYTRRHAAHGAAHGTIAVLRSASLASAAQQEIERQILDGELQPGEKLTEMTLSVRLGVSRGPIREAFRMLEEAGLLRQEKNRGVFVRNIALDEAAEIYDLRATMDELVGRRLAEQITDAQAKAVAKLVEQMERAARSRDTDTYHRLNLQFHDLLVEYAGNRKLASIYRKLVKELALARRRNLAAAQVLAQSAVEHRNILDAIVSRDADAAAHAMFEHAMRSKERMLQAHLGGAAPVRQRTRRSA